MHLFLDEYELMARRAAEVEDLELANACTLATCFATAPAVRAIAREQVAQRFATWDDYEEQVNARYRRHAVMLANVVKVMQGTLSWRAA